MIHVRNQERLGYSVYSLIYGCIGATLVSKYPLSRQLTNPNTRIVKKLTASME